MRNLVEKSIRSVSPLLRMFSITCLCLVAVSVDAQSHLEGYKKKFLNASTAVNAALLDIDYKTLEYEKSKKARYPSLRLSAEYAIRSGGRDYLIPTGDLLNPVYNNLGYLNTLNYPEENTSLYPKDYQGIENTNINFLRTKEYDAKVSLNIPIVNYSIRENSMVRNLEKELSKIECNSRAIKEWNQFKVNYYTYFKLREVVKILETNLKNTTAFYSKVASLKRSHKVNGMVLKKVELDQLKLKIEIKERTAILESKKNILLNDLGLEATSEIKIDGIGSIDFSFQYTKEELLQIWNKNNNHLKASKQRSAILERKLLLSKVDYKPSLDLVLMSGLQGENFNTNENPVYLMGALRFNWNLINHSKKIEDEQLQIIAKKTTFENQNTRDNTKNIMHELYDKIKMEEEKLNYFNLSIEYYKEKCFEVEQKLEKGKETEHNLYVATLDLDNALLELSKSKFDFLILVSQLEELLEVDLINE